LLEPWGCVVAAYTQRRRLEPKAGGSMWIVGRPGDETEYQFSKGMDAPSLIILTDPPASIRKLVAPTNAEVVERSGINPEDYASVRSSRRAWLDDIVALDPPRRRSASRPAIPAR
jgi:hypothetical protein